MTGDELSECHKKVVLFFKKKKMVSFKEHFRTFAPKNFPHTDFFKTLTDGRK